MDVRSRAASYWGTALACLLTTACGAWVEVDGRVIDAVTGAPIPGAIVHLAGPEERWLAADEEGVYQAAVSAGVYRLSLGQLGLAPWTTTLRAPLGAGQTTNVVLRPTQEVIVSGWLASSVAGGATRACAAIQNLSRAVVTELRPAAPSPARVLEPDSPSTCVVFSDAPPAQVGGRPPSLTLLVSTSDGASYHGEVLLANADDSRRAPLRSDDGR